MNFKFLPSEWNVTNLGNVAEVLDPQPDHRTPPEVLDGIPYIGVSDFLPNGKIDIESCRKVSKEVWAKQQTDILIDEGGIIFGKIGTIGLPRLLPKSSIKYALSANVVLIKPKINNFFVLYWLKSEHITRQIYRTLHTTSQPALGIIKIRQLIIASPSPSEQCKIVEILSSWDKAIALLEQLITAKRKLKQGLMQQLLTGKNRFKEFEGSEWKKVRLGNMCSLITKGTTPSSVGFEFSSVGVNYIKIESITEYGQFIPEKLAKISEEAHQGLKRSQLEESDILFSIAGALGRVAIVSKHILPANTNQALAIIRLQKKYNICHGYLFQYLKSELIVKHIDRINVQAAQANLSLAQLNDFEITVPSLKEQQKIASILSAADTEISTLEKQLSAYKQQKRGLMQQLLTGKKRVKLDEPVTLKV